MLQNQREAKVYQQLQLQRERQAEEARRLEFERELALRNLQDKEEKRNRQQQYSSELAGLVSTKAARDSLDRKVAESQISRHNPITNPIEYHIDNPYLLKRMQEKHGY